MTGFLELARVPIRPVSSPQMIGQIKNIRFTYQ
jgi:hypothetical protein